MRSFIQYTRSSSQPAIAGGFCSLTIPIPTVQLLALDPKLKRMLTRIYDACRYIAEQCHGLRCDLHEMKTHPNLASDPPPPLPTFPDPFEDEEHDKDTEEAQQEYQEEEVDYDDDGDEQSFTCVAYHFWPLMPKGWCYASYGFVQFLVA